MALASALSIPVFAHSEREADFPDGTGSVPAYRTSGEYSVVCKPDSVDRAAGFPAELAARVAELAGECAFEHIQAAVDAVPQAGWRILVLPGVYREEPSRAAPSEACAAFSDGGLMEYAEHVACPNVQNLVAVLGDDAADEGRGCDAERLCGLQIEGVGAQPADVTIDGEFAKLNVIRADRADGFYLRNVLVQKADFNSVYVIETDGFVLDRVVARYNDEYGILTFAVDHGLYVDCEAYGNGDAGLYPGSASDLHGARPSVEITRCNSHHNMAGYSGTAGNSVYVHDNEFHHNGIGLVTDSFYPNHPGLPQDSGRYVANRIYSNNENYFDNYLGDDAPCAKPVAERDWTGYGTVCPAFPSPIGTGFMIAGGNANLVAGNWFWDNHRYGTMLFTVPAPFRNEIDPTKALDTSHFNKQVGNVMGLDAATLTAAPDGLDFWWDEGGSGNCWDGNVGAITSDPAPFLLPDCDDYPVPRVSNAAKIATIAACATWSRENHHPPGCPWMEDP